MRPWRLFTTNTVWGLPLQSTRPPSVAMREPLRRTTRASNAVDVWSIDATQKHYPTLTCVASWATPQRVVYGHVVGVVCVDVPFDVNLSVFDLHDVPA